MTEKLLTGTLSLNTNKQTINHCVGSVSLKILIYCKQSHASVRMTVQMVPIACEPQHNKTTKKGCASSEDSDQPGHPPSLIRVFAVCMKEPWVLHYPLSTHRRLIRLGGCPGWSESSLGAHSFCWFCHVMAQLYMCLHVFSSLTRVWLHQQHIYNQSEP